MNKKMTHKIATVAAGAALAIAPVVALAPTASAAEAPVVAVTLPATLGTDIDPTPAGDVLGVIETDGEQDIVAITTEIDPGNIEGHYELRGDTAVPCETLDESVRVQVEGQENYCYLNRSHLARDINPGDLSFPTADVDPATGIQAISFPLEQPANPAVDAANSGKFLAIGLSALALAGTAYSLTRRRAALEA